MIVNLSDGLFLNGNVYNTVTIKPLNDGEKDQIISTIDKELADLIENSSFQPVNDKHKQATRSSMILNELIAASITSIGDQVVCGDFAFVCERGCSALDWSVIVSHCMALDEYFNGFDGWVIV
ncbi:TPA: hypothetical protein ACX6RY_001990 [Photobacterium damselae]